ncbi:MAG: N-acetyltransferase [Spirochaetales bacterium]|nr:MAG: N-acetyltransferase [Spirochaetales bacterium]
METEEILGLYDRYERKDASFPRYQREEAGSVVRMIGSDGDPSLVTYSRLSDGEVDAAIERELAYFKALGRGFEWKYYSHDIPDDLVDRLAAHGFAIGDEEAIMALDLDDFPAGSLADGPHDIRRVGSESAFADFAEVNALAWPDDHHDAVWVASIKTTLFEDGERMSAYVAYVDGVPVCASRIDFPEHSPFASLWGGATLEPYRRRGIYGAMLSVRAKEAITRGYRFLTIDASPMSRPIAASRGFRLLCLSRPCDSPGAKS